MKGRGGFVLCCLMLVLTTICCLFFPYSKNFIEQVNADSGMVKIIYVGQRASVDSSKPQGNLYNPYSTIQEAVNVESGSSIKICLISDLVINDKICIDNKNVTIDGKGFALSFDDDYSKRIFEVGQTSELVVTNITIDGGNKWSFNDENLTNAVENTMRGEIALTDEFPVFDLQEGGKALSEPMFVNYGTLSILGGTTIQNCYFYGGCDDFKNRLIYSEGSASKLAYLVLENVQISRCLTGEELVYCSLTDLLLSGASYIVENLSLGGKAGIFRVEDNSVIMTKSGVVIKNNFAFSECASVLFADGGSKFLVNGGVIKGNRAMLGESSLEGATIVIHDADFVMNSGSISDNISTEVSGLVFAPSGDYSATFNSGEIRDNGIGVKSLSLDDLQIDLLIKGESLFNNDFVFSGNIFSNFACNIKNKGIINGNIVLDDADVVFENSGTVNGNLSIKYGKYVNFGRTTGEVDLYAGIFQNDYVLNGRVIATVGEDDEMLGKVTGFCESEMVFQNVFGWVAPLQYIITFDFNGGINRDNFILRRVVAELGELPEFDAELPTMAGYVFYGWDAELTEANCDKTYFALWEEDKNGNGLADVDEPRFTISYIDGIDNEVLFEDFVVSGLMSGDKMPKFDGKPIREGYTFWGWDKKVEDVVTKDVVYVAVWIVVPVEKDYSWVSVVLIVLQILGLVIASIPTGYILLRKYKKFLVVKSESKNFGDAESEKIEKQRIVKEPGAQRVSEDKKSTKIMFSENGNKKTVNIVDPLDADNMQCNGQNNIEDKKVNEEKAGSQTTKNRQSGENVSTNNRFLQENKGRQVDDGSLNVEKVNSAMVVDDNFAVNLKNDNNAKNQSQNNNNQSKQGLNIQNQNTNQEKVNGDEKSQAVGNSEQTPTKKRRRRRKKKKPNNVAIDTSSSL